MANSFSLPITYNKKPLLVVVVPELRSNGMHYEVNINAYPRFVMSWTELGRYDITDIDIKIPYDLLLAVSDALEQRVRRKK
ncbi:MAG: hypothetical protein EBZ77_00455 [Chitinophagia bacterium]|nr:hypothetical protein [Chitinophagia bacterium]